MLSAINKKKCRIQKIAGAEPRHAVGERKLTGFNLTEDFRHERYLDDAHSVHRLVGVNCDLFACLDALDVDTPLRINRPGDTLDVQLKTGQGRDLLGLLESPMRRRQDADCDEHTTNANDQFAHTMHLPEMEKPG